MKNIKLILSLVFVLTAVSFTAVYGQNNKHLIVLVKYKTLPEKESLALVGLRNLLTNVRKEPYYVNVIIHVDPIDKSNILLYEHWSNEEYYKGDHLKTSHLQQFMNDSRLFLAGPPEITFWKIND